MHQAQTPKDFEILRGFALYGGNRKPDPDIHRGSPVLSELKAGQFYFRFLQFWGFLLVC
jgi:hypothetical protein